MSGSTRKFIIIGATGLALALGGALPAFASGQGQMRFGGGVFGTVSSISGSTITVAGKNGTNYTVDASSAKVMKSATGKPVTAALSDIAAGDTVAVIGAISGDNVTAKAVIDGVMTGNKGPKATHPVMTNGRIVGGTISAITGSDLTLTLKAHPNATTTPATVTVHTTLTTVISKDGQKVALADLAAGQMAIISGTKNADGSVEASRIFVRTKGVGKMPQFSHFKQK